MQAPTLKLKPFIMDDELLGAEKGLDQKGLTKAIVDAAVDRAEQRNETANRAEVQSLLRFVAMSHYLNREEPKITKEITKILSFGSRDAKLKRLSQFLADTFKGWGQDTPISDLIAEDLVDRRTTSTKYWTDGWRTLTNVVKRNDESVDATARELESHSDGMAAKLYRRWVETIQRAAKRQEKVLDAGSTRVIKLNLKEPLQQQYGDNWIRRRWMATELDEDDIPTENEPARFSVGKQYYFQPPKHINEPAFLGIVQAYNENTYDVTVRVTRVIR
ncbi:MAG: hypothetical protein AMJ65_17010 [Phycisphaerae bacterium SG8_4]|nr:MAG: hypothetical protein AMJ65_17010 [Phycisphaerae bacterium SG8_4]